MSNKSHLFSIPQSSVLLQNQQLRIELEQARESREASAAEVTMPAAQTDADNYAELVRRYRVLVGSRAAEIVERHLATVPVGFLAIREEWKAACL